MDDEDLFHLVFEDACSLLDISLSLNALNSSDEAAKLISKIGLKMGIIPINPNVCLSI